MGAISFTLDTQLVEQLRRLLSLTTFVETGTFKGDALEIARTKFAKCYSVELSEEYYHAAKLRFAGNANIQLFHGDSAQTLAAIRSACDQQPTLFWLDAHWCAAENTAGEKSQCPLLGELSAIGSLQPQSAILIDDARLFLSPPPKPHEISAWPSFDAVQAALHRLSSQHALVCFNDVLIFAPRRILPELQPFLHEHTVNLLTLADKAREYDALLEQAKTKDKEIAAQHRIYETLLAQAKAKDREIEMLHATARERLEVIQKLDVALEQTRQSLKDLGQAPHEESTAAKTMTGEIASLRLRLDDTRRQLQIKTALLRKLELQDARRGVKRAPSFGRLLLDRWQAHLAATTSFPLGKLSQYAPRPMRAERFPRSPRLANWPRICLVTPSYQQAQFLERTMQSVFAQEYPNLAYGVQDGGSTDGSATIITRHLPQLAHAESTPDHGQADAIHRGFAKLYPTHRDIMGWLNSDDMLMPGALKFVGAYFARHPEVDVVYGHRVVVDDQDQEIGRWFLPTYHGETLKWFDLVPQETMFWRSRCYHEIGGIDASFQFAMDWDLLLRFAEAGCTIHRLPRFLGCFRSHAEQKTSAKIASVGEREMDQLRQRTHGRAVQSAEIQKHLDHEIRLSAMTEWLHRHGLRL